MKNILFIISLLFLFNSQIQAQYQTDTWFAGYLANGNTDRDSVFKIQIVNNQVVISYSITPHSFESTFASISDKNGNLLLYTNGCMIADNSHQVISNGEGLNPGPMASELCGQYGYISEMGAVFIPVPDHSNDFWLIHMGIERDTLLKTHYGPLYASYIDGSSGSYVVTIKNQVLLTGNLERFAVVKHGNGRDWWLVAPKYSSNEYYKFLITPDGIIEMDIQPVGPVFHFKYCSNGRGTNTFSNTGKYYVRYNVSCGPVIFNFDRCTGMLEDPVSIIPTDKQFGGGGVAFNAPDKKMYYDTQNQLYRINLDTEPFTPTELASWEKTGGHTLGNMFFGPDSNIYICPMASSFNIHVLYPDFKTPEEDFLKIKGINLPARNTRTLPFYANYKLGPEDNSACDSIITSNKNVQRLALTIYPNPSHHSLNVDLKDLEFNKEGNYLQIFNSLGKQVFRQKIDKGIEQLNIDISDYTPGCYVLKLNSGNLQYMGKIVIQ